VDAAAPRQGGDAARLLGRRTHRVGWIANFPRGVEHGHPEAQLCPGAGHPCRHNLSACRRGHRPAKAGVGAYRQALHRNPHGPRRIDRAVADDGKTAFRIQPEEVEEAAGKDQRRRSGHAGFCDGVGIGPSLGCSGAGTGGRADCGLDEGKDEQQYHARSSGA
jgi:hypothetical protein